MKQFLFKIVAFVLVIITVNLLLINQGNKLYFKNYKKYALNYNAYLLADSHGLPLGNETEKYRIYNFSAGSESYFDMQRKLHFLIENTKVDTIYISVDNHTLSPYRERTNNLDRSLYYATKKDYDSNLEYYKDKFIGKIIFLQPKIGVLLRKYFVSKLDNLFTKKQENVKSLKNWNDLSLTERTKRSIQRAESQFGYPDASKKLTSAFISIIKTCKKNNIELIGVKFPITDDYKIATKNKNFGADYLLKSHGNLVIENKYLPEINNGMFVNQDHLNREGGKIYTELLFNKSKNP